MPFKKKIKFLDLDGNPVEEDFYFGLSKAEIAELHVGVKGGSLEDLIKRIVAEQDGEQIIAHFKRIISMSIGERDPNNRRFIKNDSIRDNFFQSDAYSELFVELLTNPTYAAEFIRNLVPADYAAKADELDAASARMKETAGAGVDMLVGAAQAKAALATAVSDKPAVKTVSASDVSSMSREDLQAALLAYQKANPAE